MPVLMRPLAVQDIRATFTYLAEQAGAETAGRFVDAVSSTSTLLTAFPFMGSPCNFIRPELAGLRRWPVKGFERWQLFYLGQRTGIIVVRVLHTARNIDEIFG